MMIQDVLPLLEGFYGREIAELYRGKPWRATGPALLMCAPVWGSKYLDRFEKLCLPSIMSRENHEALKGRCRMVLFTDIPSYSRLLHFTEGMEDVGFDLDLRIIPKELMDTLPTGPYDPDYAAKSLNKYWILGVVQNVGIQMAKRAGMAFHQLHPDHIYAPTYYANMWRLAAKHEGLAQTGISANVTTALPELLSYVQPGGALTIPDRDLGDIGWRHLHKQTRATIMNTATIPYDLPESHLWLWQGKDKLSLHCCHMNAAYMSAATCSVATSRIPATIDAELPFFMTRGFHVPTIEDGMGFIEVSDEGKADNPRRVDMEDFARHCLLKVRYSDAWDPYINTVCEVPIHPQNEFVTDERVATEHAHLMGEIARLKPQLAVEFINKLSFQ